MLIILELVYKYFQIVLIVSFNINTSSIKLILVYMYVFNNILEVMIFNMTENSLQNPQVYNDDHN